MIAASRIESLLMVPVILGKHVVEEGPAADEAGHPGYLHRLAVVVGGEAGDSLDQQRRAASVSAPAPTTSSGLSAA